MELQGLQGTDSMAEELRLMEAEVVRFHSPAREFPANSPTPLAKNLPTSF